MESAVVTNAMSFSFMKLVFCSFQEKLHVIFFVMTCSHTVFQIGSNGQHNFNLYHTITLKPK